MRYFTLAEAEALLPEISPILDAVRAVHAKAEAKVLKLRALEASAEPAHVEIALERSQLQFLIDDINGRLRKILELGAMPKGVDPTLVDFPHRLDGREVYLCWRHGEKNISHYHGLEEGFAGRRPLPASMRRA